MSLFPIKRREELITLTLFHCHSLSISETYLEPCKTSKMERFAKLAVTEDH